jgi:hypothetical protein
MSKIGLWRAFFKDIVNDSIDLPLFVRKYDEFRMYKRDNCVEIGVRTHDFDETDLYLHDFIVNKAKFYGVDVSFVPHIIMSALHEVGHIFTFNMATQEEMDEYEAQVDMIADYEEGNRSEWYKLASAYRSIPIESRADDWAISYVMMNKTRIKKWISRFKTQYGKALNEK